MTTSKDVAAAAGVSQPTVSRALRDSPLVAPATKARIFAAAQRLGYVPSQYGRQLRTKQSKRIAVLATELGNPFYMALLDPLHAALRGHGYATVVLTESANTPVAISELVDGSFDGVILTNCRMDSALPALLLGHGLAVTTVNREVVPSIVDSCAVANDRGAAEVARAVMAAGHTRIAHIGGPANTSTGRDRCRGFHRALAANGISSTLRRGEFTFDAGFAAMTELLARTPPPTAVFCGNDVVAVGALNAVRAAGLRVPHDVSVVGFDDIPMASWAVIDLATMRCDLGALARCGADFVLSRIERPAAPVQRKILEATFVPRGSLAPARRAAR